MYRFTRYQVVPVLILILLWFAAYELGVIEPEQNTETLPAATVEATPDYAQPFTSAAGLYYGADPSPRFATRLDHVMAHTKPDSSKPKHSVFVEKERAAIVALLDEAWQVRGPPKRQGGVRGRDKYQVDMNRVIGITGEHHIRLIIEADSAAVITAYPVH